MKIQRQLFVLMAMLWAIFAHQVAAQTEAITFPVDGSVFQKVNGQHNFYFSGQLKETSNMFYRIQKKNGSNWDNVTTDNTLTTTWTVGDRKGFYKNHGNLSTGWYRIMLYKKYQILWLNFRIYKDTKEFGVGDVYFIAGQSNAQGYLAGAEDDNPTPYWNFQQNSMVRIFKNSENVIDHSRLIKGMPYRSNFSIFENNMYPNNNFGVYPNGVASWCWSALGKSIADAGTPVLFFNSAIAGTSVNSDWTVNGTSSNTLGNQFYETLRMYGNVFGAKGVLWHQGERDSQKLTQMANASDRTAYLNNYATGLSNIINWSRQAVKDNDPNTKKLLWYVSQVSYTTGASSVGPDWGIGQYGKSTTSFNNNCKTLDNNYLKEINSDLISKQSSLLNSGSGNRVFLGVQSDIFSSSPECSRASTWRIHFTANSNEGNTLETLAQRWKNAIDATNINDAVSATPLIKIESISGSGSNYTLTVTNQGSGAIYYWVKNDAGINSAVAQTTTNSYTFSGVTGDDFLSCYVLTNGRLSACQPFVVPGGSMDTKSLDVSNNALSYSATGENKSSTVIAKNVNWDVTSAPSWLTINFDEDNVALNMVASQNTSTSGRTGIVTLQEIGGGLSKTISITQSGSTSTTTQLSSLTPTSVSQAWGTLHTNQSVEGNSLRIGGVTYYSGLGTHAYSNIKYNLGGQYATFSGKVGLDDEVDAACEATQQVQFIIKADGVTLWTSSVIGQTMSAQAFTVQVSGKNQLELIVEPLANNYCDHTDWVDTQLSTTWAGCGTIPVATNVNANPGTISSGQSSTLSATCSQGTVTWSNGASGGTTTVWPTSTTTYSVTCVSGACSSSPVYVSVTVQASGVCSGLYDGLVAGTWNVTGTQLKVRSFHNKLWLTQVVSTSPDKFVVRGSEMLQRSDVALTNNSYSSQISCFGWIYSGYGGLVVPDQTVFPIPSGYILTYGADGTPIMQANSGCTVSAPTSVAASPSTVTLGQSSTLSAACSQGTVTWSTGATGNSTSVSPSSTTTYTVKCVNGTCISSTINVTVTVQPSGTCSGCNGYFDVAFSDRAEGWAKNGSGGVANLDFWINGVKVAANIASNTLERTDVGGWFGFRYYYLAAYCNGQQHQMDVKFAGTGQSLINSPKFFTCTSGGARVAILDSTLSKPKAAVQFVQEEVSDVFVIYPNPTHGAINVKFSSMGGSSAVFWLVNDKGQVLKEQSVITQNGQNALVIESDKLTNGSYLLTGTVDNQTATKRVIIEK